MPSWDLKLEFVRLLTDPDDPMRMLPELSGAPGGPSAGRRAARAPAGRLLRVPRLVPHRRSRGGHGPPAPLGRPSRVLAIVAARRSV